MHPTEIQLEVSLILTMFAMYIQLERQDKDKYARMHTRNKSKVLKRFSKYKEVSKDIRFSIYWLFAKIPPFRISSTAGADTDNYDSDVDLAEYDDNGIMIVKGAEYSTPTTNPGTVRFRLKEIEGDTKAYENVLIQLRDSSQTGISYFCFLLLILHVRWFSIDSRYYL